MKWKLRVAHDMAQEAIVVIAAPTSEEAEAIFWHDMDPDVICWSNDNVIGDREVVEICPAGDKDELTALELLPVRQPKEDLKTYRVHWVIEVEADTPLCAARQARAYQTQPGRARRGNPQKGSRNDGTAQNQDRSAPNAPG